MFPADAIFEAHDEGSFGLGVGDIPIFGLGLAAQLRGNGGGRVHLQAEAFLAIEPFYENREGAGGVRVRPQDRIGVFAEQIAEGHACKIAPCHHRLRVLAIHNLPAFPDDLALGQLTLQTVSQIAATPDPFHI